MSDRLIAASLCRLLILLLLPLAAIPPAPAAESALPPYTLGVFPHLPPRELEKVFAPIAADLGRHLGREVQFRSSSTYRRFMQRLESQSFDIVFVQPFDYVTLADRQGYLPLATRRETLSTIFVVAADSPLRGLNGLRGRHVALPPEVAAVSRLARRHFEAMGLVPGRDIRLTHHRSHISCMQQVIIGAADACGTARPAKRFFEHRMGTRLREIGETDSIPHTLFAVSPRVPAAEREILRRTILSWTETPAGRLLLERGRLSGFRPIDDAAYDVVRRLAGGS